MTASSETIAAVAALVNLPITSKQIIGANITVLRVTDLKSTNGFNAAASLLITRTLPVYRAGTDILIGTRTVQSNTSRYITRTDFRTAVLPLATLTAGNPVLGLANTATLTQVVTALNTLLDATFVNSDFVLGATAVQGLIVTASPTNLSFTGACQFYTT